MIGKPTASGFLVFFTPILWCMECGASLCHSRGSRRVKNVCEYPAAFMSGVRPSNGRGFRGM